MIMSKKELIKLLEQIPDECNEVIFLAVNDDGNVEFDEDGELPLVPNEIYEGEDKRFYVEMKEY